MKIDFTKTITDLEGNEIDAQKEWVLADADGKMVMKDNEPVIIRKKGEPAKFRTVAANALLASVKDLNGDAMIKRFDLARKITKSKGAIEITVEEGTLILESVQKNFGTLLYGAMYYLINTEK